MTDIELPSPPGNLPPPPPPPRKYRLKRFGEASSMAVKRFGRGARSFERRAAPKVRAFGSKAGTRVGTSLSAASVKARYGLTPRQYATWVRLSNKMDDAEELTPAELAAYNRINEKARMHRERLKELGLRAGSSAKRVGRAFYGSGRLRA